MYWVDTWDWLLQVEVWMMAWGGLWLSLSFAALFGWDERGLAELTEDYPASGIKIVYNASNWSEDFAKMVIGWDDMVDWLIWIIRWLRIEAREPRIPIVYGCYLFTSPTAQWLNETSTFELYKFLLLRLSYSTRGNDMLAPVNGSRNEKYTRRLARLVSRSLDE